MIKEYGYEYSAILQKSLLEETQGKSANEMLWGAIALRSGRDAIRIIARECRGGDVLLPALCCDSMIVPFELYECHIHFYRLNKQLKAELSEISNMLDTFVQNSRPTVLLRCNYFGLDIISDNDLFLLKSKYSNLVITDDITHTFLSKKERCSVADFSVASLRKWSNVSDGGLLWTSNELKNNELFEDLTFAQQRLRAQCMRTEFFATGNEEIKKSYRSIFSSLSDVLDTGEQPIRMSEYAYRMAKNTDWEDIRLKRKENADALRSVLKEIKGVCLIEDNLAESNLYVPFLLHNRNEIQTALSRKGIFNTVIWPLRESQKDICSTSKYIEENMLAAPCDQRYSKEDMKYIGAEIAKAIYE